MASNLLPRSTPQPCTYQSIHHHCSDNDIDRAVRTIRRYSEVLGTWGLHRKWKNRVKKRKKHRPSMIKQRVEEFAHNSTSAPLQVRPIARYWIYRYKYPLLERFLASSLSPLSCFFQHPGSSSSSHLQQAHLKTKPPKGPGSISYRISSLPSPHLGLF